MLRVEFILNHLPELWQIERRADPCVPPYLAQSKLPAMNLYFRFQQICQRGEQRIWACGMQLPSAMQPRSQTHEQQQILKIRSQQYREDVPPIEAVRIHQSPITRLEHVLDFANVGHAAGKRINAGHVAPEIGSP